MMNLITRIVDNKNIFSLKSPGSKKSEPLKGAKTHFAKFNAAKFKLHLILHLHLNRNLFTLKAQQNDRQQARRGRKKQPVQ